MSILFLEPVGVVPEPGVLCQFRLFHRCAEAPELFGRRSGNCSELFIPAQKSIRWTDALVPVSRRFSAFPGELLIRPYPSHRPHYVLALRHFYVLPPAGPLSIMQSGQDRHFPHQCPEHVTHPDRLFERGRPGKLEIQAKPANA